MVPPSAAPSITLTHDEKRLNPIRASVVLSKFTIGTSDPGALQGRMSITAMPANIAFDVLVRCNSQEVSLSSLTAVKGSNGDWQIGGSLPGINASHKPARIDLILRSSEKAARRTVNLTEIWDGKIIYPNIPLGIDANR